MTEPAPLSVGAAIGVKYDHDIGLLRSIQLGTTPNQRATKSAASDSPGAGG